MSARTRANIFDYSVGVGTEDVFVLPPTFGRNFLSLQNVGPGTCAVSFSGSAAAANANGSIMLGVSAKPLVFQKNVPQNAIHAISGTSASLVVYSDDVIPAGVPFWILNPQNPPAVDLDFMRGRYWVSPNVVTDLTSIMSCTRASSGATDLLPTSTSGQAITTFGPNTLRLTKTSGLINEEQRTNQLLNSTTPNTQTTASLGTGTYTLWCNGSGTATASVGTATAPSLPLVASQGVQQTFAITVAGTIVVTVAGSLNAFQLELGSFGTSLISTAGVTVQRVQDIYTLINPLTLGSASSLFYQGNPISPVAYASNQFGLVISDGTANNKFVIRRISGTGQALVTNNGSSATAGSTAWTQNTSAKAAMAIANNDLAISFNGGTPATSTLAWPPTATMNVDQLSLSGSAFDGLAERIAIWPLVRLDNATLQRITT